MQRAALSFGLELHHHPVPPFTAPFPAQDSLLSHAWHWDIQLAALNPNRLPFVGVEPRFLLTTI